MFIVYGVLMFAALIGMIICNKKQNVMPVAKVIAMGLLLVVIVCGVLLLKEMNIFGDASESLRNNENHFYASQGYVAGKFVKDKLNGGKVLVMAENDFEQDTRLNVLLAALKEGLGTEDVVVDTVKLPGGDPEMPEPLSERMRAKDFDAVVAKYPDAKVIVSLIGVPRDAARLKLFQTAMAGKGPALILLGGAEMPGMAKAIEKNAIAAAIVTHANAVFDEKPAPRDMEEAFKIRYILVDKENVAANSGLFSN